MKGVGQLAPFFCKFERMTPGEALRRVNRINVTLAAQVAIENTADAAATVQRGQLFQGIGADGEPIVPPYTPRTVAIKSRKGQVTDRVTLRDTGDFYRGILIDVRQDIFTIQSADEKNISLQQKYGTKIFGLATPARIEYIRTLRPEFIRQIKSFLQ